VRKIFSTREWDKIRAIPTVYWDWSHIPRLLESGDVILLQFPPDTFLKAAFAAVPSIKKMKRHGIHIIILIHDLDSLRGQGKRLEATFLPLADVIIAHNGHMISFLREQGFQQPCISLDIFDYLVPHGTQICEPISGIDIAGNLDPYKTKYIYEMAKKRPELPFNLYGPNFDRNSLASHWYHGSFTPEQLLSHLSGSFGLVWDGDSPDTCLGLQGEYLRFNNPHKLSLYIAAGKPVIIWDKAAEASFVTRHNVGIAASSIYEGVDTAMSLSADELAAMTANAKELGNCLQRGDFTKAAIQKSVSILTEGEHN
jgi:hypothetical protein